ncbi:hypothetical protein Ddye_015152 [Dipteronia dyeriana]|uniref:Nuclear factor related to kappa-B-binding protein second winged helix domain-containing protein n=1 Tax=Dipteronia dyeriana TaxID=168575 RepID=A0AAD9U522_9ROSI|nr:hypothetical protein Ddye_015152 [Dipteronia dyeriana]
MKKVICQECSLGCPSFAGRSGRNLFATGKRGLLSSYKALAGGLEGERWISIPSTFKFYTFISPLSPLVLLAKLSNSTLKLILWIPQMDCNIVVRTAIFLKLGSVDELICLDSDHNSVNHSTTNRSKENHCPFGGSMANPPNQDRLVEVDKSGAGEDVVSRISAALSLMDLVNHACPVHKNMSCTYREDLGATKTPGDKEVLDLVDDSQVAGSSKLDKKKRKASNGFSSVQSESVDRKVGREGELHETSRTSNGHKLIIKLHKKGGEPNEYCLRNGIDGLISTPLLGCDQVTKKKKKKKAIDVQNVVSLVISDLDHSISSFKEKSSKKVRIDADVSDIVLVSETRSSMKPRLSSIIPSVYNCFTFSIIHFLTAVRIAMTIAQSDDSLTNALQMEKNNLPSLTISEIVERVRSNPLDALILRAQEPLEDLVRGALTIFSSKKSPVGADEDWKALASYLKSRKGWSWIGPVSSTGEAISAESWGLSCGMLATLVDCFADWLRSVQDTHRRIANLPAPPFHSMQKVANLEERMRGLRQRKCVATINPCSEELRAYFRMEETLRYKIPDRAFLYTAVDGRKSAVAPLRKANGKSSPKSRDHFMLKANRPPNVTILCVVRDAAARLPGGMGTRPDVSILMRDSQYIIQDFSDKQINEVASRSLDRLHYAKDPCIRYDADLKFWVYLHGEKEEDDFEVGDTGATTSNGKSSTEQSMPPPTKRCRRSLLPPPAVEETRVSFDKRFAFF